MIETRLHGFKTDLVACMRFVRKRHGKGFMAQLFEILRLRFGRNRLGVVEYFVYGLYDDSRFSIRDKSEFVGWRRQRRIYKTYIPPEWLAVAHDKLLTHSILSSSGLRQPELRGLYHPYRSNASVPAPRDPEQLKRFLREEIDYPFFMKPVWGEQSLGIADVDAFDRTGDSLIMGDGSRVSIDDFIAKLESEKRTYCAGITVDLGILFQERLLPHPLLKEVCGACLSSARIVVLVGPDGPEIFRAAWKIPVGRNMADNFWRQGNMLASIDAASGRIGPAFRGVGPNRQVFEHHPDSGQALTGLVLPDWEAVRQVCLAAAACLPGIPFQGWDIAFTSQGPVALEINPLGGLRIPQLAPGAGFGDPRLERFVAELESQ